MALEQLPKERWQAFFDTFAQRYLQDEVPEWTEVELVSPELGDQRVTGWQRLEGVGYDPRSDRFVVSLPEYTHAVARPSEIWVEIDADGFVAEIEVVHEDGATKDLVHLRRRAPEAHGELPRG